MFYIFVKNHVCCSNAPGHLLQTFPEKTKNVNVVKAFLLCKIISIFEIKTLLCVKMCLKSTPGVA